VANAAIYNFLRYAHRLPADALLSSNPGLIVGRKGCRQNDLKNSCMLKANPDKGNAGHAGIGGLAISPGNSSRR